MSGKILCIQRNIVDDIAIGIHFEKFHSLTNRSGSNQFRGIDSFRKLNTERCKHTSQSTVAQIDFGDFGTFGRNFFP